MRVPQLKKENSSVLISTPKQMELESVPECIGIPTNQSQYTQLYFVYKKLQTELVQAKKEIRRLSDLNPDPKKVTIVTYKLFEVNAVNLSSSCLLLYTESEIPNLTGYSAQFMNDDSRDYLKNGTLLVCNAFNTFYIVDNLHWLVLF